MPSRRVFMGSSVIWAVTLSSCDRSIFAPQLSPGAIDIHAHVFNGRDIAVVGFLTTTILRDAHVPLDADMATTAFLRLLQSILLSGTPSARQEIADLRAVSVATLAADVTPSAESLAAQDERNVADGIASYLATATPDAGLRSTGDMQVLDRLIAETDLIADPAALERVEDIPQRLADRIYAREQRGQKIVYARNTSFVQTIRWAGLLTRSRRDIVTEMVRLYGQKNGIQVFCPSLVDFARWYPQAEPYSAIEDQIEVMSLLAKIRTDVVLLNFAPFCPLRAALEREDIPGRDPLWRVKGALLEKGFAGVKLYPPVGFKPLGNGDISFAGVARAPSGGGAALDLELRNLYQWCESNRVPIKAHANNSLDRGKCTGLYASPLNWASALNDYPQLRLDLAHFGGFDANNPADSQCDPVDPRPWEEISAFLIGQHEHLYVDVGYWIEVMSGFSGRDSRIKAMRRLIEQEPRMARRIMYGSDWSMIGQVPGHEAYLADVQLAAVELGLEDDELADFEGGNARRFLGLYPDEPQFARLSGFFGPDHLFARKFGTF